jgi:hypothetical protein
MGRRRSMPRAAVSATVTPAIRAPAGLICQSFISSESISPRAYPVTVSRATLWVITSNDV